MSDRLCTPGSSLDTTSTTTTAGPGSITTSLRGQRRIPSASSRNLPHLTFDALWELWDGDQCLAWAWTLRAFLIAFSEDARLLDKLKQHPGYHVYAHSRERQITDDRP